MNCKLVQCNYPRHLEQTKIELWFYEPFLMNALCEITEEAKIAVIQIPCFNFSNKVSSLVVEINILRYRTISTNICGLWNNENIRM